MQGHAIDGGNSISKTQNSEMDLGDQASLSSLPKIKGGGTMQIPGGIEGFIKQSKSTIKNGVGVGLNSLKAQVHQQLQH
jgi:hypothetical protein